MTAANRAELTAQHAQLYHEKGEARREGNWDLLNLIERVLPAFEIALRTPTVLPRFSPLGRRLRLVVSA
jgi:hypothetical protein